MPKRPPYARIAITLPAADLAAADRLAREQDRARSWVIAEAIRRYAGESRGETGLGQSRRAQLLADLQLTPEARVRAAEDTARVSHLRRQPANKRVIAFDRYEDYLDWKRFEEAGG
jgi:hypothetical protein